MLSSWEQRVQTWFRENPMVCLELPNGFFGGRAHEIDLDVTFFARLSSWALVELSRDHLLVLREPIIATASKDELFISCPLSFFDYKSDRRRLTVYSPGEASFYWSPGSNYGLAKFRMKKKWKELIEHYFADQTPATAVLQTWVGKLLGMRRALVRHARLLSATVLSQWVVLELSGSILLVFRNPKRVKRKRSIKLKRDPQKCCDELVITGYSACIYDRVGFQEAPSRPLVFTGGEVRFLGRDLDAE
jgi:hypothetical protein